MKTTACVDFDHLARNFATKKFSLHLASNYINLPLNVAARLASLASDKIILANLATNLVDATWRDYANVFSLR